MNSGNVKILLINNFYYHRGGDCTYLFSLKKLLEHKGHKAVIFSMHHPENYDSEYSNYFVSHINYNEELKNRNLLTPLKVLSRSIYSRESRIKIEQLIKTERPDIAHVQNIHHHITPSIFYTLRHYHIPIVWTLHDYTLICPNTSFVSHGSICEKCKKVKYYWPTLTQCKKNSLAASTMAGLESTMLRLMNVYRLVNVFIAPSNFMRNKLLEYGMGKYPIVTLHNFIDPPSFPPTHEHDNYCLYIGRLSEEKGIKTLIDATVSVGKVPLKIVGDGPMKEALTCHAQSIDTSGTIEFLGHRNRSDVIELVKRCRFLVLPSEWYEVLGYAILEAFACAKPVIASHIGGIPELVTDDETGYLFTPGDASDLASKINNIITDPQKSMELGLNGRKMVEENFNGEIHYNRLMELYSTLIHQA